MTSLPEELRNEFSEQVEAAAVAAGEAAAEEVRAAAIAAALSVSRRLQTKIAHDAQTQSEAFMAASNGLIMEGGGGSSRQNKDDESKADKSFIGLPDYNNLQQNRVRFSNTETSKNKEYSDTKQRAYCYGSSPCIEPPKRHFYQGLGNNSSSGGSLSSNNGYYCSSRLPSMYSPRYAAAVAAPASTPTYYFDVYKRDFYLPYPSPSGEEVQQSSSNLSGMGGRIKQYIKGVFVKENM
jgi:hypothetical protein